MTKRKSKPGTVTDVDEIAAEAEASLEMIRAAAQQIQQLAAIRSRFEDMAQKYDAMNARTEELNGVIQAGGTLHREFQQTTDLLIQRMSEQEERNQKWQKEVALGFQERLDAAEKANRAELSNLGQQLQEQQKTVDESAAQTKRLTTQLRTLQVLLVLAILLAVLGVVR